jgi:hypothetical protein
MNLKETAGFDNGQGSSKRCPTLPAFYHIDTLSHWRLAACRVLPVLLPPSLPPPPSLLLLLLLPCRSL